MSMQTMKRYTKEERGIAMRVCAGFFISGLGSIMLGSLLPYLRDAHSLDLEQSGLLLSLQSMGSLLAICFSGFFALWLGRKKTACAVAVFMAAGFTLLSFGTTASLLFLACFLQGVGRGGTTNFGNTMGSAVDDDGSAMSLGHSIFAIGAFSSPFVLIAFVQVTGIWQSATIALILLSIVLLALYATMVYPPRISDKPAKSGGGKPFAKNIRYWIGGCILLFYTSVEYSVSGWLVTYFRDSGLLSIQMAQAISSLLWLLIFAGRFSLAFIGGKFAPHRLLVFAAIGFVAFFSLLVASRSLPLIIIAVIGSGLFMAPIYPLALAGISDIVSGNDIANGIVVAVGGIGGIAMPFLIGFVSERVGIFGGMSLCVVSAVLTLLFVAINLFIQKRGIGLDT